MWAGYQIIVNMLPGKIANTKAPAMLGGGGGDEEGVTHLLTTLHSVRLCFLGVCML